MVVFPFKCESLYSSNRISCSDGLPWTFVGFLLVASPVDCVFGSLALVVHVVIFINQLKVTFVV